MCLTLAFFLAIFVRNNAILIPNNFVQINKFALTNDEFNVNLNNFEYLKNILMNNLIVTSDNLKTILNLERKDKQSKNTKFLQNENSLGIQTLFSKNYFKNNNQNELSNWQSFLSDNNSNNGEQKIEDQPKTINKRQIGGEGDRNSQVVVGTFQAIMKPMTLSGLNSLGSVGQLLQTQNENVKQSQGDEKSYENDESNHY